jgi:endonuclease/exonuclease/phosphatase family metal-dependent hydrolase
VSVVRLISWNLLHRDGAGVAEVAALIGQYQPDLLLMQEVTEVFQGLVPLVGGVFDREPLPERVHGLAMWMPRRVARPPQIVVLPSGAIVRRVCQIVTLDGLAVANVHLSHGQVLNRRQLRFIKQKLPFQAAVVGDFNMLGPAMLPGFHDAGPRRRTHRMSNLVPLRLDRCLLRGLVCTHAEMLPRGKSDHHPILLQLEVGSEIRQQEAGGRIP